MATQWEPASQNDKLVPGDDYYVLYHVPDSAADWQKDLVTNTLATSTELSHAVVVTDAAWANEIVSGKADGWLITIKFTAASGVSEAGIDLRAILAIMGAVILFVLAVNGTVKEIFHATSNVAGSIGNTAQAASKLFDPLVLLGIAVVLFIALPYFTRRV